MVGNDMQSYFYLYSVMTSVALAVHLIINWHQLVYWRHGRPRVGARECSIFLFSLEIGRAHV